MILENTTASTNALISADAIALLPDYARHVDPGIVRLPVDTGMYLTAWVTYSKERHGSAKTRAVVEEVLRLFMEDRDRWFS